jgi:hypothetical protein
VKIWGGDDKEVYGNLRKEETGGNLRKDETWYVPLKYIYMKICKSLFLKGENFKHVP